MRLLLFLTLTLSMATSAIGVASSQAINTEPPTAGELKSAIDAGMHWIRAQQATDGTYGTADETAAALEVFATSPRRYRPVDGPFFAQALTQMLGTWNGKHFASKEGDQAELNRRAVLVLKLIGDPMHGEQLEGALRFLATQPKPVAEPSVDPLMRARAYLISRDPSGAWPKKTPRLLPTLNALRELIVAHDLAKTSATGTAPRTAKALPPLADGTREELTSSVQRGVAFLLAAQDAEGRWGFGGQADPGITAMVVGAIQALGPKQRTEDTNARLDRALDWLRSLQKADGGIHAGQLANYVTSASVMALAKRNSPEDAAAIARARTFLVDLQADEGEGYSSEDLYYGGVGYGGDERPDLSNMQMALEALSVAGAEPGDDTFQKAIAFLQRCQNQSETNDLELIRDGATIVSGNDGGAGYAPGESKAGFVELPDGTQVPRSYGSMTYALLKCYLFAGVPNDDPRVAAAWKWITEHYTLDVNPGFEASSDPTAAYQGLFYYFFTMAKALALYGEPTIVDPAGRSHDWRTELGGRLVSMQRQDGSWVNTNAERWYEGNPILATAYALTTLDTLLVSPNAPASK